MNRTTEGRHQKSAVTTPNALHHDGLEAAGYEPCAFGPHAAADAREEQVLRGTSLSPGVAIGRACFYRAPSMKQQHSGSIVDETERLRQVLPEISQSLERLAHDADTRVSREAGDIFRAQGMLLADPALMTSLETTLQELQGSAEAAITLTFERIVREFQTAGNVAIQERAEDFYELKDMICAYLDRQRAHVYCQDSAHCQPGECRLGNDHILIANRLIPGTTIGADQHTLGFIVENGGASSHAAILARMMGLPAVSGISDLKSSIPVNSRILLDGDSGRAYINPSPETLTHYRERPSRCAGTFEPAVAPVPGLRILADLDRTDDIPKALAAQAEGVGLYRSETEPMIRQRFLTEDEQFERYSGLLDAFPDSPVCVRLLDLGADKSADWLHLPPEDNPALGCRGARLLLERSELLQAQARALARASHKRKLQVLYPMVHSLDQFLQLRAMFDAAISDMPDANVLHGIMFEVPSACIDARTIFEHADFGRIGTNDLTQYLFAADRTNSAIDQSELFEQTSLWALIEDMAHAATDTGKPLSICGELAANPHYTHRILQTGINEISVCPRRIATLRLTYMKG